MTHASALFVVSKADLAREIRAQQDTLNAISKNYEGRYAAELGKAQKDLDRLERMVNFHQPSRIEISYDMFDKLLKVADMFR